MELDERIGGFDLELDTDQISLDPEFLEAYRRLAAAAFSRNALPPWFRELVGVAINAAVTHLYPAGIRRHIVAARQLGATTRQIVETLELTSVLGLHSVTGNLPIVLEELGFPSDVILLDDSLQLKEEFLRERGSWVDTFDQLLLVDPGFLRAYLGFSMAAWRGEEGLSAKQRELIYVAIDASTTHLWYEGVRRHAAKAIRQGATADELVELLKLLVLVGAESFVEGARALTSIRIETVGGDATST